MRNCTKKSKNRQKTVSIHAFYEMIAFRHLQQHLATLIRIKNSQISAEVANLLQFFLAYCRHIAVGFEATKRANRYVLKYFTKSMILNIIKYD